MTDYCTEKRKCLNYAQCVGVSSIKSGAQLLKDEITFENEEGFDIIQPISLWLKACQVQAMLIV